MANTDSSRWKWDRKSIRQYRQKQEPYNDFEKMMMERFESNPFMLGIIKEGWYTKMGCDVCKQGITRAEEDKILPSDITIMVRRCSNPNCHFFEKITLDAGGKVLDYERKPEIKTGGENIAKREFTKEEIEKIEKLMREK